MEGFYWEGKPGENSGESGRTGGDWAGGRGTEGVCRVSSRGKTRVAASLTPSEGDKGGSWAEASQAAIQSQEGSARLSGRP